MGDGGDGHWFVRMEWRLAGIVGVSASVNLPFHHKVQKFSSGTGLPGWSRKNGSKTVVVWWCGNCYFMAYFYAPVSTIVSGVL